MCVCAHRKQIQSDRDRERETDREIFEMILNLIELVEIVVCGIDVMRHDYVVVHQNCVHLDLLNRANRQLY